MQVSSLCASRRKIVSLIALIQIVLALTSHVSLNHTFCLHALWLWLLKVRMYVFINRPLHVSVGMLIAVCTASGVHPVTGNP